MSVEVSVNLPDDIAAYLRRQRDASAAVAEAVQARIDAERERRRQESAAYADYLRRHPVEGLDEATSLSNEISLREAGLW
jgi:hypothetical protein